MIYCVIASYAFVSDKNVNIGKNTRVCIELYSWAYLWCRQSRSITLYHTCKYGCRPSYSKAVSARSTCNTNSTICRVIAWSKDVILGRQPVYTVPAPSIAQVGILVLPPWYLILTLLSYESFVLRLLVACIKCKPRLHRR